MAFDIGNRIRELRELSGIDGNTFAESLNVSRSYLSLLENNKRPCSIERIYSICNTLNISITDFFKSKEGNDEETYKIVDELKINKNMYELVTRARKLNSEKLDLVLTLCEKLI